MMYCPQCGTQNRDGARFCIGCGATLAAPAPPAHSPAMPPAQAGGAAQHPPPPPTWGQHSPSLAAAPPAAQANIVSSSTLINLSQYALPAGALLLFIGSFLPWIIVREPFLGATASLSGLSEGMNYLGGVTLLAGLALGGMYLALRFWSPPQASGQAVRMSTIVLVGAILLLTLVLALYVGNMVRSANSLGLDEYLGADVDLGLAKVGVGLYLALFGAFLSVLGAVWLWQRQ